VGGIPMLSDEPDRIRLAFIGASMLTNIGLFFGPVGIMFGIEYVLINKVTRKEICFLVLPTLFVVFLYFTIVTRVDIFRVLIFAVVFFNYSKKNLNLKQAFLFGAIAVVLFVSIMFMRSSNEVFETFSNTVKMRLPSKFVWVANPYAYIINNFWNFDYAVEKFIEGANEFHYGRGFYFFRSFFCLTMTEGAMLDSYGMESIYNHSVAKIGNLNTVVYMWHMITDFGVTGLFVFSFAAGLILAIFYYNTMKSPTLFRVNVWGIIIGMIFFSFMIPMWQFWFAWVNIFLVALAHGKIGILNPANRQKLELKVKC